MADQKDISDEAIKLSHKLVMARFRKQKTDRQLRRITRYSKRSNGTPPSLKPGVVTDSDFDPRQWLESGIKIIRQGNPTSDYDILEFSSLLVGAELFLKGTWLAQYKDCRSYSLHEDYTTLQRRNDLNKELRALGHNLINIIDANIKVYNHKKRIVKLLKAFRGMLITSSYHPLSSTKGDNWAANRYPNKLYRDNDKTAHYLALQHFPGRTDINYVFEKLYTLVDHAWGLTKTKRQRSRRRLERQNKAQQKKP